ncbi:MAG: class II D-tagatose-bisphosphate aldolase, non-catalytic subunit [Pseudomonadota bacterium]
MSLCPLTSLASAYHAGAPRGLVSVCSAHPLVLRAAIQHARDTDETMLIEATCNQVNHEGGYTGKTPSDFAEEVAAIQFDEDCPQERIILGGDHLGPNPWRHLPAQDAMKQAGKMIEAYVASGFRKIHIDASMGCAGEPEALDDTVTAKRAANLAKHAEAAAATTGVPPPHYVIGTEVPPPGGADHVLDGVTPTQADAAKRTFDIHRAVFAAEGLNAAFTRVIGLVVQPGVEFGNQNVVRYNAPAARGLSATLKDMRDIVFEAHSTDYQGRSSLIKLVRDGYAILKVGPELTFALREALYKLDLIASEVSPAYGTRPLYHTMEQLMIDEPKHWNRHYSGTPATSKLMRHYALSDRIRYYWNVPIALQAVDHLFETLGNATVPWPVLRQFLPQRELPIGEGFDPEKVVIRSIIKVLKSYSAAASQETAS